MHPILQATSAVVLAFCASSAMAHGTTRCEPIPQAEWQPQMALQDKLKSEGWKVRQVKTWNNCYEVYGTDTKGERIEAFFNPKTFERVDDDDKADKK